MRALLTRKRTPKHLRHKTQPAFKPSRLGLSALLLMGSLVGGLWGCSLKPAVDDPSAEIAAAKRNNSVLKLLYSRTPTTLNPHLANGFQDFEAARIVYEPLATYQADGKLIPVLAAEIPTIENGGLAEDGLSVTWKLKPDVRWSDGTPFTAADVVFTYNFVSDPEVAAVTEKYYEAVEKVEAVDPQTVKITFKQPNPSWSLPFTGQNGMVLPKHIFAALQGPNVRIAPANLQPVGTGPYRFITLTDGRWTFAANEQYRGDIPAFTLVELQGGITPYVAARQVLRDGTADFAHSLQLSIDDRKAFSETGKGRVVSTFGSYVERLMLNPTDPEKMTKEGERSSVDNPHPFLSDRTIRQAIDHAINRDKIAEDIYGSAGEPVDQLLPYPKAYVSADLTHSHDPAKANTLLDQAGWIDTNGNGIRDKDGQEMQVVLQTSIDPVRQRTQAMIQADLADVGIAVELRRVVVDSFFSANPSQTRSINHFYADMQEYNAGSDTPDPAIYMSWWLCDEIASLENKWQKPNNARYCNEEYDQVWEQASQELDPDKRAELFQQLNKILVEDAAVIPLVRRAVVNGVSDRLTGIDPTPWDTSTWDIGTWKPKASPVEENTESKNESDTEGDVEDKIEPGNEGEQETPTAPAPETEKSEEATSENSGSAELEPATEAPEKTKPEADAEEPEAESSF